MKMQSNGFQIISTLDKTKDTLLSLLLWGKATELSLSIQKKLYSDESSYTDKNEPFTPNVNDSTTLKITNEIANEQVVFLNQLDGFTFNTLPILMLIQNEDAMFYEQEIDVFIREEVNSFNLTNRPCSSTSTATSQCSLFVDITQKTDDVIGVYFLASHESRFALHYWLTKLTDDLQSIYCLEMKTYGTKAFFSKGGDDFPHRMPRFEMNPCKATTDSVLYFDENNSIATVSHKGFIEQNKDLSLQADQMITDRLQKKTIAKN